MQDSKSNRDWPSGSFGGELMRRRVPHMLGIFLGAAWIGVEFTDWLVERYQLSPNIVDMMLVGLLAMAPSVLVVAWFHGAPGRDRWRNLERIGVPLNGVAAALLASQMNGTQPRLAPPVGVGSQTIETSVQTVDALDEDGQPVVRQVVKESFLRGVSVFFPSNETDDADLDWLQYGFAVALRIDLGQNPYLDVWSPFDEWEQYGFFLMRKAGYPDGLGLPAALQRQIAQQGQKEFFLSGRFSQDGPTLTLTVDLNETASGATLSSFTASGTEPFALVDEVSAAAVEMLAIPNADERLTNTVEIVDLPVADRLTQSQQAFRYFVEALVELNLDNDTTAAIGRHRQAIDLDPSFALANLELGKSLWNAGDGREASAVMQRAIQHEYRLLEPQKFLAKSLSYGFSGEREKQLSVLRMWSELAPHDPDSFINLAFMQLYSDNDIEGALANFERAVEVAPSQSWLRERIALLFEVQGDRRKAIETLDSLVLERPDDHGALVALGQTLRREGRFEEATRNFERANLLEPTYVDPILGLFEIALRRGDFDLAEDQLGAAERVATTPRQQASVIRAWLRYYETRGLEDQYLAKLPELDAASAGFRTPLNRIIDSWVVHMEHYAFAGRADEGFAKLAGLADQLEPPVDSLLQLGHLRLHMALDDADGAEQSGQILEQFMRRFKRDDLEYGISFSKSEIAYLRGDLPTAIALMEEAKALFSDSIHQLDEEEDSFAIDATLARYYFESDRFAEAGRLIDGIMQRFPAHPESNILKASIALSQGQSDEAEPYLAQARLALEQANPSSPNKRRLDQLLKG